MLNFRKASFGTLILLIRTVETREKVEFREKVDILDEAFDDLECDLDLSSGGGSLTIIMTEFRSIMGLGLL